MSIGLGHLYVIIGSISFLACVVTLLVLIKKFLAQPPPSFFSYSDIIASALFSLALLLDGVIGLVPDLSGRTCYHLKLLYGLFVVAIVTGFFSVLGMSIERFHVFAVVRDYSTIKRKFSIIWFLSSWTLSIVFVIILLPQIRDNDPHPNFRGAHVGQEHKFVPASAIFPGPHSATAYDGHGEVTQAGHQQASDTDIKTDICVEDIVPSLPQNQIISAEQQKRQNDKMMYHREKSQGHNTNQEIEDKFSKKRCPPEKSFPEDSQNSLQDDGHADRTQSCVVDGNFIKYYFLLLFLICFLTPVFITISLNLFISLAVRIVCRCCSPL